MGAPLSERDFLQELSADVSDAAARRTIAQVRSLLELAANGRLVSEAERRWFAAPPLSPDVSETGQRARKVLHALSNGAPWTCREASCRAQIYMVTMARSGKLAPYNADGSSHFGTCPGAKRFRQERGRR